MTNLKSSSKETSGSDSFTGKFYQTVKRRISNNPSKTLPENREKNTSQLTLIPKPEKETTTKLQTNTPYKYRHKNSQQNTRKQKPGLKPNLLNSYPHIISPFQGFSTLTSQIKSSEIF